MAMKNNNETEQTLHHHSNTLAPTEAEALKDPTPRTAIRRYLRPSGMRLNRGWDAGALSRLMQDICGRPVSEAEIIKEMTEAGFRTETGPDGTFFDVNTSQIVNMAFFQNTKTRKGME